MSTRGGAMKITGLNELLRTLNDCPPEVNKAVRAASKAIADDVASGVRGWLGTAQAAPLLTKVRATNDRVPTISIGGSARSGLSGGATRGELLGANFGASIAHQFPPKRKPDYYVYTAIKHRGRSIYDTWANAVLDVLARVDPAVNRGA